jgi:hypothetical protein
MDNPNGRNGAARGALCLARRRPQGPDESLEARQGGEASTEGGAETAVALPRSALMLAFDHCL